MHGMGAPYQFVEGFIFKMRQNGPDGPAVIKIAVKADCVKLFPVLPDQTDHLWGNARKAVAFIAARAHPGGQRQSSQAPYGLKGPARPGVNFGQLDIVKGDTLTVLGRFTIYGGSTLEMKDGRLVRKADGPDHNLSFYDRLERKPSFKGKEGADGLEAFKAWVQKNLKKAADGATGTVEVRFVVGRNGGIQEVQAIKGGTPAMRAEAVRVVQSAPKWKPALSDGSPVRMPYTLEVRF